MWRKGEQGAVEVPCGCGESKQKTLEWGSERTECGGETSCVRMGYPFLLSSFPFFNFINPLVFPGLLCSLRREGVGVLWYRGVFPRRENKGPDQIVLKSHQSRRWMDPGDDNADLGSPEKRN
jgi:hypothetical protein